MNWCQQGWPSEDNIHMFVWYICFSQDLVWFLQCFCDFPTVHDVHFFPHDRKVYWEKQAFLIQCEALFLGWAISIQVLPRSNYQALWPGEWATKHFAPATIMHWTAEGIIQGCTFFLRPMWLVPTKHLTLANEMRCRCQVIWWLNYLMWGILWFWRILII